MHYGRQFPGLVASAAGVRIIQKQMVFGTKVGCHGGLGGI